MERVRDQGVGELTVWIDEKRGRTLWIVSSHQDEDGINHDEGKRGVDEDRDVLDKDESKVERSKKRILKERMMDEKEEEEEAMADRELYIF